MTGVVPRQDSQESSPIAPAPRTRRRWQVALVVLVAALALGAAAWVAADGTGKTLMRVVRTPEVSIDGIEDGDLLSAGELAELRLVIATTGRWAQSLQVALGDGVRDLTADEVEAGEVVIAGDQLVALGDGEHELVVAAGADREWTRRTEQSVGFTVDTTAPTLTLPDTVEADGIDDPLVLEVEVAGATELTARDGEVEWDGDGPATITWATAPSSALVTATDEAGNATTVEAPVIVPFPGGRAVHTTPSAWRYEPKRTPIIEMLEAGLIDAVEIDIKDEIGDVGWDTEIDLADASGAEDFNRNFDMAAAIETIHSYDARVIGRLVVYRDSRLAKWAWTNGRADMVIQATDGTPYQGRYGDYAFTNFANPDVQQYNLDIALEAADLGFDDILYDYIRRPDGTIDKLVIPGLGDRTPEEAVVEVMATAYPLLRERGLWVGASVFGIAIDRPTQMAQDIPLMAPHVDYIAPMVYPNHWNLGEYDVPDPEKAPYDIVQRSLTLYHEVLEPTGTALMPWLQNFGGYGEAEIRAQIDATEDVTGERSFLLWCSCAEYTRAALDPIPGRGN